MVLSLMLVMGLALDALGAITITADPQPVTRVAGDYAVFTVQATGAGTLGCQWKKNGADIPDATQQGLVLKPVAAGPPGARGGTFLPLTPHGTALRGNQTGSRPGAAPRGEHGEFLRLRESQPRGTAWQHDSAAFRPVAALFARMTTPPPAH